jgi:hypothetical protein
LLPEFGYAPFPFTLLCAFTASLTEPGIPHLLGGTVGVFYSPKRLFLINADLSE